MADTGLQICKVEKGAGVALLRKVRKTLLIVASITQIYND